MIAAEPGQAGQGKRALLTGGGGFVGQWMAAALLERGWEVHSAGLVTPRAGFILSAGQHAAVQWHRADVTQVAEVRSAVESSRPDAIVHLAGISFVPAAAESPAKAFDVNVGGAAHLLAEVVRLRNAGVIDPTVLVVGSAEQYGAHPDGDLPLTEQHEQRPLTVYAASKAAQEIAALQAWRGEGVKVICTRSFNHSGKGHDQHFLAPALVTRALALRGEHHPRLRIGNGDTIRDYLHVADVVDAYLGLLERGTPGEAYNVCSGVGTTVRELCERVLQRVGVTAEIIVHPDLVRAVEVHALVGSAAKLHAATGWTPRRSRDDIIDDLIHAATH